MQLDHSLNTIVEQKANQEQSMLQEQPDYFYTLAQINEIKDYTQLKYGKNQTPDQKDITFEQHNKSI